MTLAHQDRKHCVGCGQGFDPLEVHICAGERSVPRFENSHRPGEGIARRMDVGKAPVVQGFLRYFARSVFTVALVSEYGDRKYAQPGKPRYSPAWQDMADGEARSADSEVRHLLKPGLQGDYDDESELAHLAHKAWNALAELEIALKSGRVECRVGNQIEDGVPVPGTFKRVSL